MILASSGWSGISLLVLLCRHFQRVFQPSPGGLDRLRHSTWPINPWAHVDISFALLSMYFMSGISFRVKATGDLLPLGAVGLCVW
ncbi:hypothetical protein F5Y14DRAFT_107969 [Nemania sp. NC0429]|nr:hypothetical protein F5Y14DRAFT_107969 [Nemania sp. NC0429]